MDSQQILIVVIVVLTLINLVLSSVTLSRTGSKSNYAYKPQTEAP